MTKHFHLCLILFVTLVVACQPNQQEVQEMITNEIAIAVPATKSAFPIATTYATTTVYPTQIPLNTSTPYATQQALATATYYPTATSYPTHTPSPTETATPIPPTSPPSSVNLPSSTNNDVSPLQKQIALLEQMNFLHSFLAEFQGLASTLQDNPDCGRIVELYNDVTNLPQMDMSGTDESVQQAYIAYRSAIDHFTQPETVPGDLVSLCKLDFVQNSKLEIFPESFVTRVKTGFCFATLLEYEYLNVA